MDHTKQENGQNYHASADPKTTEINNGSGWVKLLLLNSYYIAVLSGKKGFLYNKS